MIRRGWRAGMGISVVALLLVGVFFVVTGLNKPVAFRDLKKYQETHGVMQGTEVTEGRIKDAANLLKSNGIENNLSELNSRPTADGYAVASIGEVSSVKDSMMVEEVTVHGILAVSTPKDSELIKALQGMEKLGEYDIVVQDQVIFIINPSIS